MLVRREVPGDVDVIRSVTEAAFAFGPGGEHLLVDWLRADPGYYSRFGFRSAASSGITPQWTSGYRISRRGR